MYPRKNDDVIIAFYQMVRCGPISMARCVPNLVLLSQTHNHLAMLPHYSNSNTHTQHGVGEEWLNKIFYLSPLPAMCGLEAIQKVHIVCKIWRQIERSPFERDTDPSTHGYIQSS